MTPHLAEKTPVLEYVELNEGYYAAYEAYTPDLGTITRIAIARPTAHVVIPSRMSCSDCIRNVPRMARIANYLPGWTWEVYDHDSHPVRNIELGIASVPTFIVYDFEGGNELGRIVENPVSGWLEADLLQLVTRFR